MPGTPPKMTLPNGGSAKVAVYENYDDVIGAKILNIL